MLFETHPPAKPVELGDVLVHFLAGQRGDGGGKEREEGGAGHHHDIEIDCEGGEIERADGLSSAVCSAKEGVSRAGNGRAGPGPAGCVASPSVPLSRSSIAHNAALAGGVGSRAIFGTDVRLVSPKKGRRSVTKKPGVLKREEV